MERQFYALPQRPTPQKMHTTPRQVATITRATAFSPVIARRFIVEWVECVIVIAHLLLSDCRLFWPTEIQARRLKAADGSRNDPSFVVHPVAGTPYVERLLHLSSSIQHA